MTRKEEITKVIEEIENEKNTTSLMPETECYNHGLDVANQIINNQINMIIKDVTERDTNPSYKHLRILYYMLREMKLQKCEYYQAEDYKWTLGSNIIQELKLNVPYRLDYDEKNFLFGIEVEIDFQNPWNIRLFEDITNKIEIKQEDKENEESVSN